ncbi:MAG: response regulator transcription factor [bacterium]|nr:response regulator transcription factor [bacterium]
MSRKIRVLIADDRVCLRGELLRVIAAHPDLEVVGEVEEGTEVVTRTAELAPDVVLLDLAMPGVGLPALERLAGRCPGTRTVVLAMHENISLLRSVLAEGSLGYVVPRSSSAELPSVIRQVMDRPGDPGVPAGPLRTASGLDGRSAKDRELCAQHESLSHREQEVLRAVAYGYTNREIAEHLGISIKSVETYRYRLAEKLGFRSRVDLVRFALGTGLLRIGGEGLQVPSRSGPPAPPRAAEGAQARPFNT